MAFVSGTTGLARELWPEGSGVLLQDAHFDVHTLPASRVVPSRVDELADWMFVELDSSGYWGRVFVRGAAETDEQPIELVLRLQGIVHDSNLNMMGTWDRTEANAKKALQHLSLVSGGCMVAFEPQWNALANIREMVCLMLGVYPSGRRTRPGTINLRRRVFDKVSETDRGTSAPTFTPVEDPSGLLEQVSSRWRLATRLRCGVQNEEGGIVHFNPLLIRAGDLVDVSVSVAVVLRKTPHGKKCDVIFEPCTIVRLRGGSSMKKLLRPRDAPRPSQLCGAKSKGRMVEGFSFTAGPASGPSA